MQGAGIPTFINKMVNILNICLIDSKKIKTIYGNAKDARTNKNIHLLIYFGRILKAIMESKVVNIIKIKKSANLAHNSAPYI